MNTPEFEILILHMDKWISLLITDFIYAKQVEYFDLEKKIIKQESWANGKIWGKYKTYSTSYYEPYYILDTEYSVKMGRLHGEYKLCNGNHIIFMKSYDNGVLHGEYISYHSNGNIEVKSYYEKGMLHGLFQSWFENGNPCETLNYVFGKRHGAFNIITNEGEWQEGTYNMEKLSGEFRQYYQGLLHEHCFYNEIGQLHGPYKYYNNDMIEIDRTFINGKIDGISLIYYDLSPQIYLEEYYDMGKKIGFHVKYGEDGSILEETIWESGIKRGQSKIRI